MADIVPFGAETAGAQPESRFQRSSSWVLRQWPILLSMLLAAVVFGGAVRMYPPIPLWSDARNYSVSAWRLAETGVLNYSWAETERVVPSNAFVTPGYPVFLSAFYLFANDEASFQQSARAVHPAVLDGQFVLAVATVGLVAACGAVIAGSGLALIAGVIAAFYVPLAWASSLALSESLGTFLVALQLLVALHLVDRDNRLPWYAAAFFGVISAVVALTRPAFVLWTVLPFLYLALARRDELRSVFRAALIALIAFGLLMSVWWVRNAVYLHEFVPLATNTGVALLDSTGGQVLTPVERTIYAEAEKRGDDPAAAVARFRVSREWQTSKVEFLKKRVLMAVAALHIRTWLRGTGHWRPTVDCVKAPSRS